MDIVKKFNVTGAPTTLVFEADGKEVQRFPGYYPPADYLKQLEKSGYTQLGRQVISSLRRPLASHGWA